MERDTSIILEAYKKMYSKKQINEEKEMTAAEIAASDKYDNDIQDAYGDDTDGKSSVDKFNTVKKVIKLTPEKKEANVSILGGFLYHGADIEFIKLFLNLLKPQLTSTDIAELLGWIKSAVREGMLSKKESMPAQELVKTFLK